MTLTLRCGLALALLLGLPVPLGAQQITGAALPRGGGVMTGPLIGTNAFYGSAKAANGGYGWVEAVRPNSLSIGQVAAVSSVGKVGGVFGTRTSDLNQTCGGAYGCQGTISIEGITVNDRTTPELDIAFGAYIECRRQPGAGTCHVFEGDPVNYGTTVEITSGGLGSGTQPIGLTTDAWLACGAGYSAATDGITPCSGAVTILNNGQTFEKGITIGANAITGASATTDTLGRAINMGRGQVVTWNDASDNQIGYIGARGVFGANPTGILFDAAGLLVGNGGQYPVFRAFNNTGGVNYPSLANAATGTGVVLAANGTDPSIDVVAAPKGGGSLASTGPVKFPAFAYASLPATGVAARQVFCSDCLKPGEGAGGGTGMMVFDDGHAHWVSMAGTVAAH